MITSQNIYKTKNADFFMVSLEAQKKLENLIEKAYRKTNGNRIRQLVKVVANAYKENPEELRNYFKRENKVSGIATSAYYLLTKNISPIQDESYGGLGVSISDSEEGLRFSRNQMQFAKISGTALFKSVNSDYSLWHVETSGFALSGSRNYDCSLWHSKNKENSLVDSKNYDYSLYGSANEGFSLWYSKNHNHSLYNSANSRFSLGYSINAENTIRDSDNSDHALWHARKSKPSILAKIIPSWVFSRKVSA